MKLSTLAFGVLALTVVSAANFFDFEADNIDGFNTPMKEYLGKF